MLNIGPIRMYILMDTRNVEQTKDVHMYTCRIYSSRYLDTLLHKVEVDNIGKMLVYMNSQQRIGMSSPSLGSNSFIFMHLSAKNFAQ